MNRWSRIVWTLALGASIAWVVGGAEGYRVHSDATLARHTLITFGALLGLVLTHTWVGVYLLTFERLLKRRVELGAREVDALRLARVGGVASAVGAIAVALLEFLLANALYPARLDPARHAVGGAVSALLLATLLVVEGRALSRAGGIARASEV